MLEVKGQLVMIQKITNRGVSSAGNATSLMKMA